MCHLDQRHSNINSMGNCSSKTTAASPVASRIPAKEGDAGDGINALDATFNENAFTYNKGVCALEYWEPITILGEGSLASIYLVRRRPHRIKVPYRESADIMRMSCSSEHPCPVDDCTSEDNKVYALKSIHKDHVRNDAYLEEMRKEIYTLRNVNGHPNIVEVIEAYERKRHIYLVMQYCSGGDLGVFERGTTERNAREIIRSILSAVAYLHERRVVHRDRTYRLVPG